MAASDDSFTEAATRPMPSPPLLQVRMLAKSFPGVVALDSVSLEVEAGKVHAVMGENGAGKSTLMNLLAGLLRPDAGEILLDGRPLRLRDPHDALRRGIAMIHQELLPFPDLTVAANIGMGREPVRRGIPGWIDHAALRREAAGLLARLGVAIAPDRRMGGLSVAEMQTVEIAKALAHEARVIIMDEPTSAISGREVEALFGVVRDLTARGVAVIYISHKMDEIFRIADTITVLRDGRHVATAPARELDERRLIALMVGREIAATAGAPRQPGGPLLELRGLSRRGAFRGIGLTLRRGEVLGLAGLMGAGRSALVNAIAGLEPATAGEALVRGRPVRLASPAAALAAGIALVGEDRKRHGFVPRMSVQHNLTLAALRRRWIDHRAEAATADAQMRALGIKAAHRGQAVGELSGGNQQKVVIAKALLSEPEILLLDEPTRGIDIGAKAEVHAIVDRLARDGMAILLVSSELPELLALSDRLLVMREGTLAAELDPRRTSQEEIMEHAMPA
jgi:inositol transport system ATP-binding protein